METDLKTTPYIPNGDWKPSVKKQEQNADTVCLGKILELREYNNNYYHTTRKSKNIEIVCECGKKLKKESLRIHLKSPKHQLWLLKNSII